MIVTVWYAKKMKIMNIFTFIVNITKEVKKMKTNLYIRDHVFNVETLVFGYKIYAQAYFDPNLLITLTFLYIYKAYYISNQKQKKVDIFKVI